MSFRRILNRVAVASGVTATSAIIATKRNISARDYQKNETFIDHKYDLDWDKLPNHNGERVIYLVRHGRYHIEREDLDDQKLTEMGRNQLTQTGKYLAGIYKEHHNNEPPEIIISSTMIRAIESRDLIMNEFSEDFFNEKSVKMTDLLREGAVYKPVQFPDRPSYNTPEYERNQIIGSSRLEAALYEYLHKGRRSEDNQDKQTTAIIVCHANVIRYLLCKLMQVRENAWLQMTLYHGSVTKVVMKGNGDLRVMAVGSAGFMPPELMTYSNGKLEKPATASSEKVPEK